MSKTFRAWKIDEPLFLPPMVGDFVAKDHLACFVLNLVRDDLGLGEITGTYGSERGQPVAVDIGFSGCSPPAPSDRADFYLQSIYHTRMSFGGRGTHRQPSVHLGPISIKLGAKLMLFGEIPRKIVVAFKIFVNGWVIPCPHESQTSHDHAVQPK
jgi:hypothetical protein